MSRKYRKTSEKYEYTSVRRLRQTCQPIAMSRAQQSHSLSHSRSIFCFRCPPAWGWYTQATNDIVSLTTTQRAVTYEDYTTPSKPVLQKVHRTKENQFEGIRHTLTQTFLHFKHSESTGVQLTWKREKQCFSLTVKQRTVSDCFHVLHEVSLPEQILVEESKHLSYNHDLLRFNAALHWTLAV
jgi:hypothetical protein